MPRTEGALAALPRPTARVRALPAPPQRVSRRVPDLDHPVQRRLQFGEPPAPKVVAFDAYTMAGTAAPARPRPRADTASRTSAQPPAQRRSRVSPDQGNLEFLPAAPAKPRTLDTSVESVLCCDAPVAAPMHRAAAAVLDGSMVLIGYGLFLLMTYVLAFYSRGEAFASNKLGLGILVGMLALMALAYKLYWALAGTESAGMRWMHLHLVTFDGFPPEKRHFVLRSACSCLSLCTVLGQLWLLLDEESLAWQDHMSRTFPTPWELESRVLRRG
jgi:hypothetical protein